MAAPEDDSPDEADDDRDSDPMNPEAWYGEPDICGSCIAWRPRDPQPGEDVATGLCRLRAELPRVPASLKKCDLYKPRGQYQYKPSRERKRTRKKASTLRVLRRTEDGEMVADRTVSVTRVAPRERPPVPRNVDVGTDDARALRQALRIAITHDFPDAGRELTARFERGQVKIVTKDGRVERQVSTERFFELIERFRVSLEQLEDKMVSTEPLLDQFAELRKQMLGIQGTFTTFNFLYSSRSDYFSGKG